MAVGTITVQGCVDYARLHTKLQPLLGLLGSPSDNEPALTWANSVKRKILEGPFGWSFNRSALQPFNTVNLQDEYPLVASDMGWLENGYMEMYVSTSNPRDRRELEVKRKLSKDRFVGDPREVALGQSMRSGNNVIDLDVIAIRPVPSTTVWTIYLNYQRSYSRITALTDKFTPIPDTFEDVIKTFFLAYAYKFIDEDQRSARTFAEAEQLLTEAREKDNPNDNQGFQMVPGRDIFLG